MHKHKHIVTQITLAPPHRNIIHETDEQITLTASIPGWRKPQRVKSHNGFNEKYG